MSKKICITSTHAVGCTFVDWSIHFLSGQTKHYNADLNQWVELNKNPIDKINAHNHKKNHPAGYLETKLVLDKFDTLPDDVIASVYPQKLFLHVAGEKLNLPVSQSTFDTLSQFIKDDLNKIFDLCTQTQTQMIFVLPDTRASLYNQNIRVVERFITSSAVPSSEQELIEDCQELYFKDSIQRWKDLNLTEPWDIRERMALDMRPGEFSDNYKYNLHHPHLCINCLDLWTRTEAVLKRIMHYLDLDIVPERLQQWLPICAKWQEMQLSMLDFVFNQPHIVDAIVNNWYHEIDLTFQQEAVIQHYLIYQHGLNLKTWQLSKFPSNTQDLHQLLEPNIHPVPKIY